MRLEFRARQGWLFDKGDPTFCLVCGVDGPDGSGTEHYLNLQRGFEDGAPDDDDGVHCEFDDQINGAYNCVRRCLLTRTKLEVDFSRPIDRQKKYDVVSADVSGLPIGSAATLNGRRTAPKQQTEGRDPQ